MATAPGSEKFRDFVGGKKGDGKWDFSKRGEKGGGAKQRAHKRCLQLWVNN